MRTRSILVDNNTGKIYNDVTSLATATPSNALSAIPETLTIKHGSNKTAVKPASSIGNRLGFRFGKSIYIQEVEVRLAQAAANRDIQLMVWYKAVNGMPYILQYIDVPQGQTSVVVSANYSIPTGASLMVDITQNGIKKTGKGLQISLTYFKD